MTKGSPTPSSFEKQRDQLIDEIAVVLEIVTCNLSTLNRSLRDTIDVGTGFHDASRLWANFYKGESRYPKTNTDQFSGPTDLHIAEAETVNVEAPENVQEPRES